MAWSVRSDARLQQAHCCMRPLTGHECCTGEIGCSTCLATALSPSSSHRSHHPRGRTSPLPCTCACPLSKHCMSTRTPQLAQGTPALAATSSATAVDDILLAQASAVHDSSENSLSCRRPTYVACMHACAVSGPACEQKSWQQRLCVRGTQADEQHLHNITASASRLYWLATVK